MKRSEKEGRKGIRKGKIDAEGRRENEKRTLKK